MTGNIVCAKLTNLQFQNYVPLVDLVQQILNREGSGNHISFPEGNEFWEFVNVEEK